MATIREDNGDARADSGTQYSMSVGDVFQGRIESNDEDWIRVELTAGTIYQIPVSTVVAEIGIVDLEGNYIEYEHGGSMGAFAATVTGTHYIKLWSYSSTPRDYEITIFENTIPVGTYDEIAGQLTDDFWEWSGTSRRVQDVGPGGVLTADITDLTEEGQQLARWALEAWTNVTGITFHLVDDDDADITFGDDGYGGSAYTETRNGIITYSHVNVSVDYHSRAGTSMDSGTFRVYIHEIGHALGLGHSMDANHYGPSAADRLFLNDNHQVTVMSAFYQDHDSSFFYASRAIPVTPMIADIIAIQNLYGVPTDIRAGDTVYGYQSNVDGYLGEFFRNWTSQGDTSFENPVALTLYDSGGIDTLDLRTDSSDQRVDLHPEAISDVYGLVGNLVIARDTLIENFVAGSGNDRVIGNAAPNHLQGSAGNDKILGNEGNDTLEGGSGDDQLQGNNGNDTLEGGSGADHLQGGTGTDWISYQTSDSAVTIDLGEVTLGGGHAEGDSIEHIENVRGSSYPDLLEGDESNNELDGYHGNDVLRGNGGHDVLEGGAGADTLAGGAGADTASYAGSGTGVVVRLHSGEIRDGDAEGDTFAVMVTVEYTGSDGGTRQETVPDIENLRGTAQADTLAGDSRANRLEGGAGDDRLFGGPGGGDDALLGGPGADALFGGIGDDVLEGGPGADTLNGGPGADTASYAQSVAGVEIRLHDGTVLGGDAEGDVLVGIENVTGSAYADILAGDADPNRLDGGAGVDWLSYAASDAGVDVRLRNGAGSGGHAEGDVFAGFENIEGSDYNDIFGGDSHDNHLSGGFGNDGLWASSGNDVLEGGAGADRLFGGPGEDWVVYWDSDTGVTVNLGEGTGTGGHAEGDTIAEVENVDGSGFNDILQGNEGSNRLYGGDGNDELEGGGGNDVLAGGAGADRLDGGPGIDAAFYRASDSAVTVNLGNGTATGGHAEGDTFTNVEGIIGSLYDDTLVGDDGDNRLEGSDGDDVLEGGNGADRLYGGAGLDTAAYRNSNAGVTVDLGNGTFSGGHAEGDTAVDVEGIEGSNYDDVLTGDSGDNRLNGGRGNDVLDGGEGIDHIDGGEGVDTVSYSTSKEGMSISLLRNTVSGNNINRDMDEVIQNIENVIGSDYADSIWGDNGNNELSGGAGNDRLNGYGGTNKLFGEAGDDELWASSGVDQISGGEGMDTVAYWTSDEAVNVNLETGTGQGGYAEGDMIAGVENLLGSNHDDILSGDNHANRVDGRDGNDELRGNGGNDVLEGGSGADLLDGGPGMDMASYSLSGTGVTVNLSDGFTEGGDAEGDSFVNIEGLEGSFYDDVLKGDSGANRLSGSYGNDMLTGGAGTDVFVFADITDESIFGIDDVTDTILDFTDGEDLIDLSGTGLAGFDDLVVTDDENGVKITLSSDVWNPILLVGSSDGDTILLVDFDIANLDASDFIF